MNTYNSSLIFSSLIISLICCGMDCEIQMQKFIHPRATTCRFVGENRVALGAGDGCWMVNICTDGSMEQERLTDDPVIDIVKHPNRTMIAILSSQNVTVYNDLTKEMLCIPTEYTLRASGAFSPVQDSFFMYISAMDTGYENMNIILPTDKKLYSIDLQTTTVTRLLNLPAMGASATAKIAHNPIKNEIAYPSGRAVLSIVNLDKQEMAVTNYPENRDIAGYISSSPRYNSDGSYIALCATSAGGMSGCLLLHMYHPASNVSECFGEYQGMDFHPNGYVIGMLKSNNRIEYWNFKTKELIVTISPLLQKEQHDKLCSYCLSFSPDGKLLFVVRDAGQCFLLPVPCFDKM